MRARVGSFRIHRIRGGSHSASLWEDDTSSRGDLGPMQRLLDMVSQACCRPRCTRRRIKVPHRRGLVDVIGLSSRVPATPAPANGDLCKRSVNPFASLSLLRRFRFFSFFFVMLARLSSTIGINAASQRFGRKSGPGSSFCPKRWGL